MPQPSGMLTPPISRRTTGIYISALILIAGMSIASHWMTSAIIQRQAATAGTVNVAGRQRMLSQRIVRLCLQMADGSANFVEARTDLLDAIVQMERERNELLHGSVSPTVLPPATPRLQAIYFGGDEPLEKISGTFLDQAQHLAATRHEDVTLENAGLRELLALQRQSLLPAQEAAVAAYQADSEDAIRRLHNIMQLLLLLMLLLLLSEALFIYRPLFHRLKISYNALIVAARTDPLTGSLNRRAFLEDCARIFQRFRRADSQLTMLALDLDLFKSINDTWGHSTGDRVILEFVSTTLKQLRSQDRMGRLGGEEFAILLPATSLEKGFEVAEAIRTAVAAAPVTTETGEQIHFSVSIGCATCLPGDNDIFAVMTRADRNLYSSKELGRNRVTSE